METKFILKFLPWVATAILTGLLLLAYGTIDSLQSAKKDLQDKVGFQSAVITAQASAIDTRDKTIKLQSASIDALSAAAKKARAEYEARVAAAGRAAQPDREAADQLLALVAPEGELAQCRAARDLLEAELVK